MLQPGDMFIVKDVQDNARVEWKTFTVIAIDRGETSNPSEGRKARAASVTILADGPRIVTKDFSFLRNYIKVAGDGKVPGP